MKIKKIPILGALMCAFLFVLSASLSHAADPTPVASGGKAVITVTADGTAPLAYQWAKAPAGPNVFAPLSGQTSAVLTISPVTAADAASYQVEVSNAFGKTTSNTVSLITGVAPSVVNIGVVVTPPSSP